MRDDGLGLTGDALDIYVEYVSNLGLKTHIAPCLSWTVTCFIGSYSSVR